MTYKNKLLFTLTAGLILLLSGCDGCDEDNSVTPVVDPVGITSPVVDVALAGQLEVPPATPEI